MVGNGGKCLAHTLRNLTIDTLVHVVLLLLATFAAASAAAPRAATAAAAAAPGRLAPHLMVAFIHTLRPSTLSISVVHSTVAPAPIFCL